MNQVSLYRLLECRLWDARWRHGGVESEEEDALLDQMDAVWRELQESERKLIDREGPNCWPMDPNGWPPSIIAHEFAARNVWTYGSFESPQLAILNADGA